MGVEVLEELECDGEDDWADHHADPEDDVLWEVNGGVGDICPREGLDIGRRLADCNVVGPHDAAETDDEAEKREGPALETVVALLVPVEILREGISLTAAELLHLHNRLFIMGNERIINKDKIA